MPLRPTIPDDAGNPVPMVRFKTTYLPIPMGPLPFSVQKAIVGEIVLKPWGRRDPIGWLAFVASTSSPAVLVFIPFWVSMGVGPGAFASAWTYAFMFAMVPASWFVMWILGPYTLSRLQRLDAARVAVKAGYCGSCGYALTGIEPDMCRLTTCPECGAAWACPIST